jgi:hypothetical protein
MDALLDEEPRQQGQREVREAAKQAYSREDIVQEAPATKGE